MLSSCIQLTILSCLDYYSKPAHYLYHFNIHPSNSLYTQDLLKLQSNHDSILSLISTYHTRRDPHLLLRLIPCHSPFKLNVPLLPLFFSLNAQIVEDDWRRLHYIFQSSVFSNADSFLLLHPHHIAYAPCTRMCLQPPF